MAGKKTGKRLLTWVLVLVMALSLLPLNALAAGGPETDGGSGMDFKKELLPNQPDGDGNYTIRMTAQAMGKEVETTKVKPMDIVLVLDQSGSMEDEFSDGTRQSAMKKAVNSFIGEVAAKYSKDANHHMAIVTFSDEAKTLAEWTAVDKDGEATLISMISGLTDIPSGATNVGAGMELAQDLMNSSKDEEGCLKTVIVFTDGVPTKQSAFNTGVANAAISAAKDMKDAGVTIYTVGIFNGANPNQLYGDTGFSRNSNGAVGSDWSDFSFFQIGDIRSYDVPAGNRFLNYLSSNFENATGVGLKAYERTFLGIGYHGWEITENFKRTSSDYYMTAANASALNAIFKTFSDMVPTPSNDALNANTVITDKLSDYFTFATGTVDNVKVYAIDADGNKKESTDAANAKFSTNGKTVTVTNYDFSAHHTASNDPEKLVIEIKVKPSGKGCASASIPTNEGNATVTLGEKEIDKHTSPTVNGYSVKYEIGEGVSWPSSNSNGPAPLYYPQDADVPVTNIEPTREGFKFNGWTPSTENDAVVAPTINEGSFTMPAANVVLTPKWTANTNTKYTVKHYQQNLNDDDYTLADTESDKTGTTGELTNATAKNYEGFTVKSFDQQTIAADGRTVVEIFYDRNTYTVTYTDGVNNETIFEDEVHQSVKYGADVPAYNNGTNPSRKNYTFAGWEPAVPDTMPANSLKFMAKWEKNPVGDGTFDFNDVDHDGKNTPAITKTVKGNVGRNFKETFKVTVEPKSDNAIDTMSSARYTGEAKVTYSGLKDIAFLFTANDKLTFRNEGKYIYTVWEIPDGTSRMSYDTTKYPLTINVVLNKNTNKYEVESWQFTAGNRENLTQLNIVNTYRTYHPSTPSKPTLNTGDHYAYVMGYPDGTVRPNGSITRAEVSAILFRLLSDKTRDEYFTTESSFTDVKAGAWYNNSIATLEKAGVIVDTAKGGAFRPNEAITRAELAAMLAQFSDAKPVKGVKFSDVSAEHWAYEAIAIAAKMGWIEGYPDGTFRPDATITRAEMMTLVNRALERVPSDEDHLLSKRVMLTFPDCKSGDWFYIAVQEATNSHTYERAATEKNGDEQWTALRANRDWTQLEK